MNRTAYLRRILCVFTFLIFFTCTKIYAQNLFGKTISIEASRQPLDKVLQTISRNGNFYFSYNSNIIKRDSLVSISATNKTVRQVLEMLFKQNFEFSQTGNYIIIKRAPMHLVLVTNKAVTEDKLYIVTGYVMDERTQQKISNASIYEKQRLLSTLTDADGFFKLKLKSKYPTAAISVSKEFYEDTTVIIEPKYNQQITITLVPVETAMEIVTVTPDTTIAAMPDTLVIDNMKDSAGFRYTYVKIDSAKIERTALGNFFISSKQKIQSLNLEKFFTERRFQISLTPGLSTHGKLSGQVVNNISLNILGGYTAGVNGIELGGLFNINKKNARYFQAAGLFNIVGGKATGVQLAGISNLVLNNVTGIQAGGIINTVRGKLTGFQSAGIYNHVTDTVKGFQLAGISNFAGGKTTGLQISGIGNIAAKEMNGLQLAGIFNYAKKLNGVQVGLINVADSSNGFSIGLINIVFKGYHKLSLYANETMLMNTAFKTGNAKLYSILMGGLNTETGNKLYSFGYGLGSDISFGKKFSINPEISSQYLYQGSWDYLNLLNKFNLNFNLKFGKGFSLFAGPSFNILYSNQTVPISGYKFILPTNSYNTFSLGSDKVKGWFGFNAGVNLF